MGNRLRLTSSLPISCCYYFWTISAWFSTILRCVGSSSVHTPTIQSLELISFPSILQNATQTPFVFLLSCRIWLYYVCFRFNLSLRYRNIVSISLTLLQLSIHPFPGAAHNAQMANSCSEAPVTQKFCKSDSTPLKRRELQKFTFITF